MKIVAIHQPNHLPWLGYWLKMACSDLFIFNDNCPLNDRGYSRRVLLAGSSDDPVYSRLKLLPPYKSHPLDEVKVDFSDKERDRLMQQLRLQFGSAPHFTAIEQHLQSAWQSQPEQPTLSVLNEAVVRAFAKTLVPGCHILRASDLSAYQPGPEMLGTLLEGASADLYLAGAGSDKYMEQEHLLAMPVPVVIADFATAADRLFHPGHLSFAAAASHYGLDELAHMLHQAASATRARLQEALTSKLVSPRPHPSFAIRIEACV